jgi:hypothetical protein
MYDLCRILNSDLHKERSCKRLSPLIGQAEMRSPLASGLRPLWQIIAITLPSLVYVTKPDGVGPYGASFRVPPLEADAVTNCQVPTTWSTDNAMF